MRSVMKAFKERVDTAKTEYARYMQIYNMNEQVMNVIDNRPDFPKETSVSTWAFGTMLDLDFYYIVDSFRDMLDLLEYYADHFDATWISEDGDSGTRSYTFKNSDLDLRITLVATPDEQSENATCRKILVGMDTVTETRQVARYTLRCD